MLSHYATIYPELFIVLAAMVLLLWGVFHRYQAGFAIGVMSILVLGGALAAGQHARIHDAAVLKTLGATRLRLLGSYICEYALLGFCSAVFGVAAGGVAAFTIVEQVMGLNFVWLWRPALAAAAAAVTVAILLGLLATFRILGQKPASYLREL